MNLRDIYIFENLSDEHLKKIQKISFEREYERGDLLFYEGEEPENLYILTEGILRVYKTDIKGHEITLHHFHPVSLIAERANFENIPYPANAEFETNGKVLVINFKTFEKELLKDSNLCFNIVKSLLYKIKILDDVIVQNLMMDAVTRTAKFIYEHEDLFISLKHNKIASILNMTPETLSRILKKFKTRGIIQKDGGTYKINREELKKLL
ncbi:MULTISPECIES: Crp/Fnr family transcriptional regulator [Persephonella]|uniref:Transcriptional regulator, Crp/Fnr family n=1 Tax=Persephonella marina (strain DSM 14350 / EX-H1) TaxID=123214 RepID=C0QTS3_PERMH|nr:MULTISPECIES: Crp/Fnr family transcriptional regulator [Persephonella]ACO03967.1 transcriptional regulator, Crp/Fnr family [Persephonella marina EX-H1]